jgi:hypothetical protein
MDVAKFLFLAQFVCTLFMTGVIWFVQVVHYPLFNQVGTAAFAGYEASHCRLTTYVVAPAMIIEAFAALLFIGSHPSAVNDGEAWIGAFLVFAIWVSTALFSVPFHNELSGGFAMTAYDSLCRLNWIRTAAWTARSALIIWWLAKMLPASQSG